MFNGDFRDDNHAILRLSAGELAAFRYLFDRHFADLCNFLNIYLHSREFSEAIALEIFEYVWEKRETLVIRSSFRSFLFVSGKNRAISHYRKERRSIFTTLDPEQPLAAEEPSPGQFMEVNELRAFLESAIRQLPDQSRRIFLMAREENLSHKEIADRLGISPKTVENHVGIALRKLRETLKPFYRQIFMALIMPLIIP
jgi:RNA polymerase sigma-70 factor (ECF subfamily)